LHSFHAAVTTASQPYPTNPWNRLGKIDRSFWTGYTMGLSSPSLVTFLISFVIAMAVLFAKYFGAAIPGLTSEGMQFAGIVAAYFVLVLGCLIRNI
jgi:hypothetical protein